MDNVGQSKGGHFSSFQDQNSRFLVFSRVVWKLFGNGFGIILGRKRTTFKSDFKLLATLQEPYNQDLWQILVSLWVFCLTFFRVKDHLLFMFGGCLRIILVH